MGNWSRRGYERISLLRAVGEAHGAEEESSTEGEELDASAADERLRKHMAAMATAMTAGVFADHAILAEGEVVAIDDTQSAEELLLDKQMSSRVREAIAALPPPEDVVVRRFYVEGHKMDAIAKDMDRSKSWVSRVHTRALRRLGARLREV